MKSLKSWLYRYRAAFPLIAVLLFIVYYHPGKWFSEPASTVIFDKNNELLGAKIAPDGQWRFPETDTVPEKFRKAIVCSEDRFFYYHPGFNPVSLFRAGWQYLKNGRIISGGSTLSMQVVRISEKNRKKTVWRKLLEIFHSFQLELTHSKEEILALYASHAPFGGNVVGIEAAAWRFYGIPASSLSWSETATLAVLPNSPSMIFPGKNKEKLLMKRNRLLDKMLSAGIIDRMTCDLAKTEPLPEKPFPLPRLAPHLTEKIASENKTGRPVVTTIQKDLQVKVNEILKFHSSQLKANEINNIAAIIVEVATGNILVYSANTEGTTDGPDVDLIISPRSTGSILKPILYASALSDGLILPNTLLPDIPMQIGGFIPQNYNQTYDGAVPASRALARSLNIPMVRLLQNYGYDQFYSQLKKMGMTTLSKPADHYGLSLILGGAETTLWDLATIYSSMARSLNRFNRSFKYSGSDYHNLNYSVDIKKRQEPEEEHFIPDAASLWFTFEAMTEVTRPDEELQWQQYSNGKRIAWKTGTSYGNRDAWAVGVTPGYVVAVWAGNACGEGRPGLTGIGSAAPVLFDIFKLFPPERWFDMPYEEMAKIPVCRYSGERASACCEPVDTSWMPLAGLRSEVCRYHRIIHLDPSGNFQVTSACFPPSQMIHSSWFVLPPSREYYFRMKNPFYRTLPPCMPGCENNTEMMEMIYPENNSRISIPLDLDGTRGSAVFRLAHRNPDQKVFWNLDDRFIGTTSGDHQLELSPLPGIHYLSLTDDGGNSIRITFEVMGR